MNKTIKRAKEAALSILKPSQSQIEHGMELHKNSIVCESYGFAPRAAVDGNALKAAVEAGASRAELQDMNEDMRMTRYATDPAEREEFISAWEAAGVTCILQNAGEEGNSVLRLIKRLARFTYATDMMPDFLMRAATPDDIVAAKEQNKHCLYLIGNGVPLPQDWESVEDELRYIRVFFQLGCRMMHLTYNRRNMIGDGCAEPANAGLSDFGRAVVAKMNRLEAAEASEVPMVASHSGCAALNPHHRCKPDEVIRAIVDTGGYIGICCVPAFLGGTGDISSMLDHIEYVIKKFGADYVTIGTDVAYTSSASGREYRKVPKTRPGRSRWEALWLKNDPLYASEWRQEHQRLSMEWTNWPIFTIGLVQRGYSDSDIQKIIGGNVLRVARSVLSARD